MTKLNDELGDEAEELLRRLLEASGYKVRRFASRLYDEFGALVNIANLSEGEKMAPDLLATDWQDVARLIDAKYRTGNYFLRKGIVRQLNRYPDTHYVIVCDESECMFSAVPEDRIRKGYPKLTGVPIEQVWSQVTTDIRQRFEAEIRRERPFRRIKVKYK